MQEIVGPDGAVVGQLEIPDGASPEQIQAAAKAALTARQADATAGPAIGAIAGPAPLTPEARTAELRASQTTLGSDLAVGAAGMAGQAAGASVGAAGGPAGAVAGAGIGGALGTGLGSGVIRGEWPGFWEAAVSGGSGALFEGAAQATKLLGRQGQILDTAIESTLGKPAVTQTQREAAATAALGQGQALRKVLPQVEKAVETTKRSLYGAFEGAATREGVRIAVAPDLLQQVEEARAALSPSVAPDTAVQTTLNKIIKRLSPTPATEAKNVPTIGAHGEATTRNIPGRPATPAEPLTVSEALQMVQQLRDELPGRLPIEQRDFAESLLRNAKNSIEGRIEDAVANNGSSRLLARAKNYYANTVVPMRDTARAVYSGTVEDAGQYMQVLKQQPTRFARVVRAIDVVDPTMGGSMRQAFGQQLVNEATSEIGVVDYQKLYKAWQDTNPLVRKTVAQGRESEFTQLFDQLGNKTRSIEFHQAAAPYVHGAKLAAGGGAVLEGANEIRKGNWLTGAGIITSGAIGYHFLPKLFATPEIARIMSRGLRAEELGNIPLATKLGAQFLTQVGLEGAVHVTRPTPSPIATPAPQPVQ